MEGNPAFCDFGHTIMANKNADLSLEQYAGMALVAFG